MGALEKPEYYRALAEKMRGQAEKAASPEMRHIFLDLAASWQELAESLESIDSHPIH